jgi:ribonucleoside-triphosphate reductase
MGQELHESDEAQKFGLKVIAHMNIICNKLNEANGMKFVLEQTPAESTAYRFAKLDMAHYGAQANNVVQGDKERGEIYYTNSTLFNVGSEVNPVTRVEREGRFHPLIEAGSITHVWLGEAQPDKAALADFVINVFRHTQNDQIAFSPEFTSCISCGKTSRGLHETCTYCGSNRVDGITRITGYFTKVSSWNKGKLGELRDRYRNRDRFGKAVHQ